MVYQVDRHLEATEIWVLDHPVHQMDFPDLSDQDLPEDHHSLHLLFILGLHRGRPRPLEELHLQSFLLNA